MADLKNWSRSNVMSRVWKIKFKSVILLVVALLVMNNCVPVRGYAYDNYNSDYASSPEGKLRVFLLTQAQEGNNMKFDSPSLLSREDIDIAVKSLKTAEKDSSKINAGNLKKEVRKPLEAAGKLLKEGQNERYKIKLEEALDNFAAYVNTITLAVVSGDGTAATDVLPGNCNPVNVYVSGDKTRVSIPLDFSGAILGPKPFLDWDRDLLAISAAIVNMGNIADCFGFEMQDNGGYTILKLSSFSKVKAKPQSSGACPNKKPQYPPEEDFDSAIIKYKQAVVKNPNNVEAHYSLGRLYVVKNMDNEAIDEFKNVVSLDPKHAEAHYFLALSYCRQKKYDLAVTHCDKAVELGRDAGSFLLERLKPCRMQYDPRILLPSSGEISRIYGEEFVIDREQRLPSAAESNEQDKISGYDTGYYINYKRKLGGITTNPAVTVFIFKTEEEADRAWNCSENSDATGLIEKFAIDGLPQVCCRITKAPIGATISAAIKDRKTIAHVNSSIMWYEAERKDMIDKISKIAQQLSRNIEASYASDSRAWAQERAKTFDLSTENDDEIIAAYEKFIAVNNSRADEHVVLGNVYLGKHLNDEAINEYKKALAIAADNADAHYGMGVCYGNKGENDIKAAECRKAVDLNPGHFDAQRSLGMIYIGKGSYDEAIPYLEKATAINPNHLEAHCFLEACYSIKGRYDDAIAECKKIVAINPKDAGAHYEFGIAYARKGMQDKAIEEFKQTIAIDPRHPFAYYYLGLNYAKKNMDNEAIVELKKSIAIDPNDARAHYALGMVYQRKGRADDAAAEFRKAADRDKDVEKKVLQDME